MKSAFLGHLNKICDTEERIVQRIDYVLSHIVTKTGLQEDEIGEIKRVLDILTEDSRRHEQELFGIIEELKSGDNQ